jgi:hypothetical protein
MSTGKDRSLRICLTESPPGLEQQWQYHDNGPSHPGRREISGGGSCPSIGTVITDNAPCE